MTTSKFLTAALLLCPPLLAGCGTHPAPPAPSVSGPGTAAPLVVTGEVVKASRPPVPGSAPYPDAVTFTVYKVLSVERGDYKSPKMLAVQWVMRGKALTQAAHLKAGDRERLEIEPFAAHKDLQRVMQVDDTDEYDLPPQWVTRAIPL